MRLAAVFRTIRIHRGRRVTVSNGATYLNWKILGLRHIHWVAGRSLFGLTVILRTNLPMTPSTSELLRIAETIDEKNAGLQSIAEPWSDTTSPAGRMVLTVFAGIAEFERSLIATRTEEGRRAAQTATGSAHPRSTSSSTKENPSAKSPGPSMSMSQRSIAAYTTRRPYDSTPFRSHARS